MTTPNSTPSIGRRAAALAAAIGLGLSLLALGWRGVAAAAPVLPAAPASAVWFVDNQPGEGLAGYWKFDQVTNTTTVNSIRLDQAASLVNGASLSFTVMPPLGIPNLRKLALNGVNQYVQVAADPGLDVGPAHFSLAAWVRRSSINTYDAIYDSGTQAGKWWVFIADNGPGKLNRFGFGNRGSAEVYSTQAIVDSNWHHLAMVVNGTGAGNLTFYVDGAASGVVTVTNVLTPTGTKRIGVLSDGGLFAQFGGDLDDLRLYDRSLSAAEVARLALGRGCAADGLSWGAAFYDLQCALDVAAAGDEVWVAKSTDPYRPGTSEFARFNLVSGVGVFGNFNGTETSRGQRPPVNFELFGVTTLSGDLLDDDNLSLFSDNARNVVDASGTSAATVLDGVRVQSGNNPDLIGGGGGGLRLHGSGQLSVVDSLFIFNQAAEAGGALLQSSGFITLDNVQFTLNTAPSGGAAALLGDALILGGRFQSNDGETGGALFTNQGVVVVTGTVFDLNRAGEFGGVAFVVGSLTLNQAAFVRNRAQIGGGALYAISPITLTDSQFLTNTAGDGGALLSKQGASIRGGLFAGNAATGTVGLGGAISVTGDLSVGGVRFEGNSASANGGALALDKGPVEISNTLFLANQAAGDGGALRVRNAGTSLTNIVLVGNQAGHEGGAIFLDISGASLAQITAVSNTAVVSGSVLFASSSGTGFVNSIIWGNGPGAIGRQGSGINFSFNLGDVGISNTGNLNGDPLFVRAPNPGDGDWTTLDDNDYGDLRLTGASRAIDSGSNTLLLTNPTTDLDGQPRFVDIATIADTGVGPAPIVDMGAYELQFLAWKLFLPALLR